MLGLFDPTPPISCTTTTNTLQQHTNHSLVCPESALARDAHRSCPGGAYTDPPNIQTHNSNHLSTTRAFVASWPLMIAVNARLPKLSLWWCDGCPPGSTFLARRGTLKGDDSGVGWHQRSIVLCSTVVAGHQTTKHQACNPAPVTVHMWDCHSGPPTAHKKCKNEKHRMIMAFVAARKVKTGPISENYLHTPRPLSPPQNCLFLLPAAWIFTVKGGFSFPQGDNGKMVKLVVLCPS